MLHSLADFVGADTTVQVSSSPLRATFIAFVVSGGGIVRIGGPETNANVGLPFSGGGSNFWPPLGYPSGNYVLSGCYMYIPTGATVSVVYAD